MSMDNHSNHLTPGDGLASSDDVTLDPALLALAEAIGACLRDLPDEELAAQHVRRAADAVRAASSPGVGSPTGTHRAVMPPARTGEQHMQRPRTHRVRGALRASRSLQRGVLALAVLVAGGAVVEAWSSRSTDDLPLIALGPGPGLAAEASGDASSRESALAFGEPGIGLIWTPVDYLFILEDTARVAAGSSPAWAFVAPTDLTAIAVGLSGRLGLPALVPSEWDPATLTVTTDDGSLTLMPSGEWYFSAAIDDSMGWRCPELDASATSSATSPDGVTSLPAFECEPPAPARGVPGADEARGLALALFDELGIADVRLLDVSVDDWTVHIWGLVEVAGAPQDVGPYVGVGFGADGRIVYANGTFSRPRSLGDYPTVSSEVALERLREKMAPGGDAVQPYPATGAAKEGQVEGGIEGGTIEPDWPDTGPALPPEMAPGSERQQVTVRIVAAELAVQYVWTASEQMILAPHYRFRAADGGEWWVIAVEDRYLSR